MNRNETEPRQHKNTKRVGKLGGVALMATLLAGGASAVPYEVKVSVTPRNAEGATCVPYTDIKLNPSTALQTLRNVKRGIITGDVSIPKKGLFHDKLSTTGQEIIIDFPVKYNLTGVKVDYPSNFRKVNSCASKSTFNMLIGKNDRSKTPAGNAEYELGVHRITTPGAESFTAACPAKPYIEFALPITAEGQTYTLKNVKKVIVTGDIERGNIKPDSDPNTGETTIINLANPADVTGIISKWGGSVRLFQFCATDTDFNTSIGEINSKQLKQFSGGEQSFGIYKP